LETPLIPYLIENNVSEKVRNKIIDLGYLTFNQFRLVEINELISDIQGKKMELTMLDEKTITHSVKVSEDRIEETEEFIDVK